MRRRRLGRFAGAAEEGGARAGDGGAVGVGGFEEGREGGEAGADDAGAGFEGEPDDDVGLVVWSRGRLGLAMMGWGGNWWGGK